MTYSESPLDLIVVESERTHTGPGLLDLPAEILLHIREWFRQEQLATHVLKLFTVSYLDLPELTYLASLGSTILSTLSSDPVLHFQRLWVVSPSRVNHHLFGRSKEGHSLRPSVGELVQRGVMKGLGIERRLRLGLYLYSLDVRVSFCSFWQQF